MTPLELLAICLLERRRIRELWRRYDDAVDGVFDELEVTT